MKHRNTILAVAAGSVAIALVSMNTIATPPKHSQMTDEHVAFPNSSGGGLHSQAPQIESTGFEVPDFDAYQPGQSNYICGAAYFSTCAEPYGGAGIPASCTGVPATDVNCCVSFPNPLSGWYNSGTSQHCKEPHIEIANPATGSQHLRFQRDPLGGNPAGSTGQGGATRVNAFTPFIPNVPAAGPTTISFDIAENSSFGQAFEYFTVANDDASTEVRFYFTSAGNIYILDYATGINPPHNVSPFIYDGTYHHFEVDTDPCPGPQTPNGTINFYYDGNLIYSTTNLNAAPNIRRAIMQTDNTGGPLGAHYVDIDNYSVVRGPACPAVCGDGHVTPPETCEPGLAGTCPPGRCIAAGQQGECTCTRICTLDAPCEIHNGSNGPFIAPYDAAASAIFVYTAATPAVEFDFCGSTGGTDTLIRLFDSTFTLIPNTTNDDCENQDSYGANSDPNASCFNNVGAPNYESCTCSPAPSDGVYVVQMARVASAGESLMVNVEKKAVCAGPGLGSCCVNNGPAFGCVDDVPQAGCTGSWSKKKCVDLPPCTCVPNCAGRQCGDDGCGGSCGTCNDNVACTDDSCGSNGQCVFAPNNGACDDHLACNGVETCGAQGCVAGTPVNCNDGVSCTADACVEPGGTCTHSPSDAACDDGLYCNGTETCSASGCVAGTNPCPSDTTCDENTDSCTPNFTPIPTVSQWGIAVMALLLLIGAKVYFSRRQSTTA